MMRVLREEVTAELQLIPCTRKPFLRRSLRNDFILCTDLPLVTDEEAVRATSERLTELGWTVLEADNLLQLDKLPPKPTGVGSLPTGERACLITLLRRHPNETLETELIRLWLKSIETHKEKELMRTWHRDWAVRLRRHQALPGCMLPWLLAYEKEDNI